MRILATAGLLLATACLSIGQRPSADPDWKAELPADYSSVILISDPKCPVQMSGPTKIVGWSYGAVSLDYSLQNVSKANITKLTIEETHWAGGMGYGVTYELPENIFWVPLMQISRGDREYFDGLSTFDPKAPAKRFPPKGPWFAMVTSAELSDGTKYDATQKFEDLSDFIDQTYGDGKFTSDDRDKQIQSVKDFALRLFTAKKN